MVALSTQLALHMHHAQGSSVFPLDTLQGDVAIDFLSGSPGVYIAVDPNPPLQFVGGGTDSGWNIVDLRFAYDTATDTGYFGGLTLHAPPPPPPPHYPSPSHRPQFSVDGSDAPWPQGNVLAKSHTVCSA